MAIKCLSTAVPRSGKIYNLISNALLNTKLMLFQGVGKVQWQRIERIISNRGVGSRKDVSLLFRRGAVKVCSLLLFL
jgi:hypothetical protein